jgi:hypothetical protein
LQSDAKNDAARIDRAYVLLFARSATKEEQTTAREYLSSISRQSSDVEAWSSLLRGLFLSNELIYVN